MTGRILLVGTANPYSREPRFALYPFPVGAAGDRLCRVILGMKWRDYLRAFDRVDLVAGPWRIKAAREAAARLTHPRRILLGAKVAAAHDVPFEPFHTYGSFEIKDAFKPATECRWLVWPHPSGRCRLWTPEAIERARAQIKELAAP